MVFGIPPFLNASQSDDYYKMFYRVDGSNKLKSFMRLHPATHALKHLVASDSSSSPLQLSEQLDRSTADLINQVSSFLEMAFAMLSMNPGKRPQSVADLLSNFEFLRE